MPKALLLALSLLSLPAIAKPAVKAAAAAPSIKEFCAGFEEAANKGKGAADLEHARHECLELLRSGIAQKRQRYQAAAASACLAASRAQAAPEVLHSACAGVTEGLVATGATCESSLDCQAPQRLRAPARGRRQMPGTVGR